MKREGAAKESGRDDVNALRRKRVSLFLRLHLSRPFHPQTTPNITETRHENFVYRCLFRWLLFKDPWPEGCVHPSPGASIDVSSQLSRPASALTLAE